MANDRDRRIDQLERELAALKAELGPQSPATPRLDEEGLVTITYLRDYPIPMPSHLQYERLLTIVERAGFVPRFHSQMERQDFMRGFIGSFERITTLRRLNGLDLRRSVDEWGQEAERWLSERGTPTITTDGSFWAAVVASGDICFSLANPGAGVLPRVGLTYDSDARMALPTWREVLERGTPRPPEPSPGVQTLRQTTSIRLG